jgi:hypothetical protein
VEETRLLADISADCSDDVDGQTRPQACVKSIAKIDRLPPRSAIRRMSSRLWELACTWVMSSPSKPLSAKARTLSY